MSIGKIIGIVLIIFALIVTASCVERVPAGNIGVKVNLLGGSKGVSTTELSPGRHWVGLNEELHLFPTFTQNYVWTRAEDNGSPTNEELGFQTSEGLVVTADVGISYAIDPDRATDIFEKYRKGVDEITDLYLRNMVRDAMVKHASTMKVESVYGKGKTTLMERVTVSVAEQVEPLGIKVEKIYWIGELRLPETVTASINAKIEATQMAERRRNEVEQSKAEADKQIEAARGEAESRLAIARAEAEAIELKGQALRNNPDLIDLNAIDKWDGKLPTYMMGEGSTPFISVPKSK